MTPWFHLTLIGKDLKDKLLGLLFTVCVVGFILTLGLMFYPQVAASGIGNIISEMLEAFPEEILARFYLDVIPDFSSFSVYFSVLMPVLFMAMCIYACYLGTSSTVRDESNHDAVLYFSQPVSRESVVLSHYVARLAVLFLLNAGLFLISYIGAGPVAGMDGLLSMLLRVYGIFYLVEVLYLSVGSLISVFLDHISQAPAAAFGLFLGTFLLGAIGSAVGGLVFLKWLSPYHHFSISVLTQPDFSAPMAVVLLSLAVSLLCVGIACVWYRRKDLNL